MAEFQERASYVRDVLRQPKYLGIALVATIAYLGVSLLVVLYMHRTLGGFYSSTVASYNIPFTILTLLSSALIGTSIALVVEQLHEIRLHTAGLSLGGVLFGSLALGCPGCFFGVFPILLSVFGVSATLAILPFNGLELQVASILLLFASIYYLAKRPVMVCRVRKKK